MIERDRKGMKQHSSSIREDSPRYLKSRKVNPRDSATNQGPITPIDDPEERYCDPDYPSYYKATSCITAVGHLGERVEFLSEEEVELCSRCKCYFVFHYWMKQYENPVCYFCHIDEGEISEEIEV